ncbi:porphobilinogen deaminase [Acrodontium crateriforme]|uniref:Porphobilinogen deaminase n=1 Tax=Acrodontium crateriforme TaxID=150365 RepID=A0AAQ3M8L0_9PEZI|nr:porphobilinogen deaminase [Acrodontium crateriforme]
MSTATEDTTVAEPAAQIQTIHIGTRQSLLARVQADEVAKQLRAAWPQHRFEIHAMSTTGDKNQKTALHKFNEKSLWTQELEVLLQSGDLDLVVHCLKDMPTQLPADCVISAITEREDPRDAFVVAPRLAGSVRSLADLPKGSVVGTSSLRRIAQMKRAYPDLKFADVRGNLGTRLAKLDAPDSQYSALVLAVAGLVRLGMRERITSYLSKAHGGMLYAVGQGALAIETRQGDDRIADIVAKIACQRTTLQSLAERSLMRTLEGGCSVPIGVETEWIRKTGILDSDVGLGVKPASDYDQASGVALSAVDGAAANKQTENSTGVTGETDELLFRGLVISLDGSEVAEVEARKRILSVEDSVAFGVEMAKALNAKGADKILQAINAQSNRGK